MLAFRSVVSVLVSFVRSFSTNFQGRPAGGSTVDDRPRLADHLDMRRLNGRIATIAEAHPFPYAVAVGLAAGVVTLLLGWLARREWIWFLFIVPTIGAGATAYTMARQDQQDRTRRVRNRQHPP